MAECGSELRATTNEADSTPIARAAQYRYLGSEQ